MRDLWIEHALFAVSDPLNTDFDLGVYMDEMVDRFACLVDGAEIGIRLSTHDDEMAAEFSSSERVQLIQQYETDKSEGPGIWAATSGEQVLNRDPAAREDAWPHVTPLARVAGIASADAFPLRHGGLPFGAVTFYGSDPRTLTQQEIDVIQTVADAASIGIAEARVLNRSRRRALQLQQALDSRVTIEQAKGVLAERLTVPMDDAFALLRTHARSHNRKVEAVAADVLSGIVSDTQLRIAS